MAFDIQSARKAGYSDDEIAQFMAKSNPNFDYDGAKKAGYSSKEIVDHLNDQTQITGPMRYPLQALQGAAKGIAGVEGIPGDVASWVQRKGDAALGIAPYAKVPVLNSQQMMDAVSNPALIPQNKTEQYMDSGYQALPFALATGPLSLARNAASTFGSGVAGSAASNNAPSWMPQWIAGALGAAIGHKLTTGASGAVVRGVNAANGNLTPAAQAYQDVGMQPQIAGLASDSKFAKYISNQAEKASLGAGKIKDAISGSVNDFSNAVKNIASGLGSSSTYQQAGTYLQNQGKQWLNDFKNKSGKLWDAVDSGIGKNTLVSNTNTQNYLDSLKSIAPNNPAAQNFLSSKLINDFNNIMDETKGKNYSPTQIDPQTGLIKIASGTPPAPLDWQTMRKLKTRVGEYLQDPNSIGDAGQGQAKQLYANLSQDMRETIMNDPVKLAQFDAANAFTSNGHDFLDTLSPLIADNVTPESAATKIMNTAKTGGTPLQAIRQNMPVVADHLGGLQLNDAAASTAGGQNATGTAVSPKTFTADMSKLSPEAYDALYPNSSKIDALRNVGSGLSDAASTTNSTHPAMEGLGFFGKPYIAYKTGEEMGIPGAAPIMGAASAGKSIVDSVASPYIATNPLFIKWASGAAPTAIDYMNPQSWSPQTWAGMLGGSFGSLSGGN